jgi:Fe-S cluster assembly iron-binding protein IscA
MIQLTNSAITHFQDILSQHNSGNPSQQAVGIRLGVKSSGCSGFGYIVDLELAPTTAADTSAAVTSSASTVAATTTQHDAILTFETLKIFIAAASQEFLVGLTVDCVVDGLNRNIKFINPNATGECGCGKSFSVN